MSLKSLSEEDKAAVLQCMTAIVGSQLIEDWETHPRLGLTRERLRKVISRWPQIDDSVIDSDAFLAIDNCMNEICSGVQIPPGPWDKRFKMTRSQVLDSYRKWSIRTANYSSGIR
jgi:hypothetical protein